MSDVYALKHSRDGREWIQECDSLDQARSFQEHSGGVLVRRQEVPGQPGLWWVEVPEDDVRVTKTRDGEGWRRVRCGKGDGQRSLILDDRHGRICLLDTWITAADVPNLIAALQAAAAECRVDDEGA